MTSAGAVTVNSERPENSEMIRSARTGRILAMGATAAYVTKVMKKFSRWPIVAGLLANALLCGCWAQADQSTPTTNHAAENLYLQLRSVGLDKSRAYKIGRAHV